MEWLGIALGSMAILMIRHLTGGGWGMVIRRILGAAMRTVPVAGVLFIPIVILGMQRSSTSGRSRSKRSLTSTCASISKTFTKTLPDHQRFHHPRHYLLRHLEPALVPALAVVEADRQSPARPTTRGKFKAVAGPGLILYGFTISFAAIDWVMSLDPSWISTIYGLVILIGEVLWPPCVSPWSSSASSSTTSPCREMLKPDFVHDHGKWMLTFIMVWAYFNFSQWLIIWAGNLPAEITFYLRRLNGGWGFVGLFLVIFHFAVPFAILLSRPFKRDIRKLVWLAVWLMFMRYVDLFWIIEPNFSTTFNVTLADVVVPFAIGGFWLAYFFRNLGALPLLPAYDPSPGKCWRSAHSSHHATWNSGQRMSHDTHPVNPNGQRRLRAPRHRRRRRSLLPRRPRRRRIVSSYFAGRGCTRIWTSAPKPSRPR